MCASLSRLGGGIHPTTIYMRALVDAMLVSAMLVNAMLVGAMVMLVDV